MKGWRDGCAGERWELLTGIGHRFCTRGEMRDGDSLHTRAWSVCSLHEIDLPRETVGHTMKMM